MSDELKNEQDKTLKMMKDWLDNLETAKQAAPVVKQAYEQKLWEAESIDTMTDAAAEIPHDDLMKKYSMEQEFWRNNLPPMPYYDDYSLTTGLAMTIASGSATYQFVSRTSDLSDPTTELWAQQRIQQYVYMQKKQQRINYVSDTLKKLNPDLATEFDKAVETYQLASSNWVERSSAGIALRNVIEHFKGELLERAINRPKEQKINWSDMAARLAKGGNASSECQALEDAEKTWKSLHSRLTDVAKNLQAGAATNLDFIFVECVDHLNAVLLLIDPQHYT